MKKFLKRLITGVLAAALAYTAVPIDVHAAVLDAAGEAVQSAVGNSIGGEQIADNEKAYFEANVNPAYSGFKEFSLANVLTVKTTLADGSKLPAGYKTIDLLWQYQLQDISHDAFIATYMNSTFLYDLDSESQYFVARANTNMTDGVRTTDAIFAFANNLGEGIDDCIYDYDTGLCYIPKKYYFEIAKNGVYTLGSVQMQLLQIQDSLDTKKEISVTINDDKLFSTSVKKTEIEVESISPDTTLKVVDDKDLRSTTADDITIRVNGAAGEREDIYYNEDTGEITIPNGAATINSVQVDINNSAVSRAVRSLFGTDVAHALSTEQMQYVRATDGSELTFKVDNGAGVPKAGDKFWIRVKELYGHEIVTTSCAANMDYSYGLAFDGIVSQEAASQNIKNYTESHTGWANAWSDGLNPDTAVPSGGDEGNSSWIQWFAQLGADNNVFSMNDSILRNGILFGFALFSPDGIASHGSFSTVDTADEGSRIYSIVDNKLAWVPGMCSHIDNYDFRNDDTAPDDGTHYDLNGNEGEYNGRISAKVLKFDDHSNEGYGDVWFSVCQYDSINHQTGTCVFKAKVLMDTIKTEITFRKFGTDDSPSSTSTAVTDLYGVSFNVYTPIDLNNPIATVETHMDYGDQYNESGKTGMTVPLELEPGFYYVKEAGIGHDDDGRRNADDYLANHYGGDMGEMQSHCEYIGISSFYRNGKDGPWTNSVKTASMDESYCYSMGKTEKGPLDEEWNIVTAASQHYPIWTSHNNNATFAPWMYNNMMVESRFKVGSGEFEAQNGWFKAEPDGNKSMPYAAETGYNNEKYFLIYVPDRNTVDNSKQARVEYLFYDGYEEESGTYFNIKKEDPDGGAIKDVSFKIAIQDITDGVNGPYKKIELSPENTVGDVNGDDAASADNFYTLTTDQRGLIQVNLNDTMGSVGKKFKVTVTEVPSGNATIDAYRFQNDGSTERNATSVDIPADENDQFTFNVEVKANPMGGDNIAELSTPTHQKWTGAAADLGSLIQSNNFVIKNGTSTNWKFRKTFTSSVSASDMAQVEFDVSVVDSAGNPKTFTDGETAKKFRDPTGIYSVGDYIALFPGDVITITETASPSGWSLVETITVTLGGTVDNLTAELGGEGAASASVATDGTATVTIQNTPKPVTYDYSFRKRDIESVNAKAMNYGQKPQGDATLESAHFSLYVASQNSNKQKTCSHTVGDPPVTVTFTMNYKLYIPGTAEATACCGCSFCDHNKVAGTPGDNHEHDDCNNGYYTVAGDLVADGYTNENGVWNTTNPGHGTLNLPDGWYVLVEDTYANGESGDTTHTKRTTTDGEPSGYTHTGILRRTIQLAGGDIVSGGVPDEQNGGTIATIDNYPIRNGFAFRKRDWETGGVDAQGDASFAYTQFLLVNESENPVLVDSSYMNPINGLFWAADNNNDRFYDKGQVIGLCETDRYGYFITAKNALPYGTYRIYELNSSDQSGVLNSELFYNHASNGAFTDGRGNNGTSGGDNTALYGDGVYGATSEGYTNIQYNAERLIKNAVQVREFTIRADYGRKHSGGNGGLVRIGTDNSNENNDRDTVSYKGENYDIWKENGVNRDAQNTGRVANDEYIARTDENVDSNILPVNGSYRTLYNLVKRGGFKVQKRDFETGGDDAQGDANFAYMQFEVINRSAGRVKVVADKNDDTKSDTDNANNNVVAASRAGVATTGDAAHTQESTGVTANTTADGTSVTKTTDFILGENAKYQDGADFNYMKGDLNVYDRDTTSADGAERPVNFASSAVSTAEKGVVRMNVAGDEIDGEPDGDGCYAPGAVICVITTDKNGAFESTGNFLPYGTYEIREVRHPEGYDKDSIGETKTAGISVGGSTQPFATDGTGGEDAYGDVNGDEVAGEGDELESTDVLTDYSYYNNENHHDALTTLEDKKATSMWNGQNAFGEAKEAIISRRFHIGYELNGIETPGTYTTNSGAVEVTTTGVSNSLGHGSALRDEETSGARRYQRYDYAIVDLTDADREFKTYNGDTEEWVVTVTVGNTTVTRPITEDELEMSFYDIVDRGGFKWQKRDWETFDDSPLGGGSFAHIEFRLYNLSHDELGSDVNNDGKADATPNVAGDARNDTTVGDTTDGDYDTGRVKVTPGLRNDATADGDTEITVIAEGENKGKLEGAVSEEITLNNITERSSSGLYEKQTVTAYTVPNVKVGYVLEMGVPDAKDGCYGSRWNPATESYVSELDELTGYIGTFMTDEHGYFETSDHFLPYGTYMIVECRTGEGYKLYHDGTSNVGNNVEMGAANKNTYSSSNKTPDVKIRQQFNIRADREMVDLTNNAKAKTIQTTDWSKLGIDIAGTKQVTINGNTETVFLESADGKVDVFDGLAFVGFGDPLDIDGDGIRDNDWDFDNDGNQLWKYVKGTNGVTKFSVSYIMEDGGILNTVVFDTEAEANAFNSALNNQKRYYGTVNGTDGAKYTFTAIDKRTGSSVTMSYDTAEERDAAANTSDSAVYLTYGVKQYGSEYLTVVNDFDDLDILLASMSMLNTAAVTTDSTALGTYTYDAEAGTDGHKITKTAYTSREVLVHDDAANIDYYVTRYEAVGEKNFPLDETKVYSTVNTNYPYGKYYETPGSEQKAGLDTDGDGIVTDYDQWNRGVERLYQHARGYTVVGDTSTAYATDADGNNYTSRSMSGWDDTADGDMTTGTSGTQANNDALQDVHATTQEGLNINGIWNRDTAHYGTDAEAYYTFINASIRGDFEIRKIDTYQHKMPNVRFLVRNKETGETHTFSTDENGEYRSTSPETIDPVTGGIAERVKTYSGDYELHSHNTNRGNANDGMWFGMTVDGSVAPVDDTLGALPYGTYDIVELPSEANGYTMDPEKALSRAENEAFYDEKGVAWYQTSAAMILWQDTFTIYKDNQTVYLNNIENIPIGENEYMQSVALGNLLESMFKTFKQKYICYGAFSFFKRLS